MQRVLNWGRVYPAWFLFFVSERILPYWLFTLVFPLPFIYVWAINIQSFFWIDIRLAALTSIWISIITNVLRKKHACVISVASSTIAFSVPVAILRQIWGQEIDPGIYRTIILASCALLVCGKENYGRSSDFRNRELIKFTVLLSGGLIFSAQFFPASISTIALWGCLGVSVLAFIVVAFALSQSRFNNE